MAEQANEDTPVGKGGTKRPFQIHDEIVEDRRVPDFKDPLSCAKLEISDIELVFSNGVLYANADMLIDSCTLFRQFLLENWRKTPRNEQHRCVFEMKYFGIDHSEVMIPFLHLVYDKERDNAIPSIQALFTQPDLFDSFLSFADKAMSPVLVRYIHLAIQTRPEHCSQIYPILKKHSLYGKRPGLRNIPYGFTGTEDLAILSLEWSFFENQVMPQKIFGFGGAQSPAPKMYLEMYESITDADDVEFFFENFCSLKLTSSDPVHRVNSMRNLLLFNKEALTSCLDKLDLSPWTTEEICNLARQTQSYRVPNVMAKILDAIFLKTSSKKK